LEVFLKKLSDYKKNIYITLEDILKHLDKNRDLLKINKSIKQNIPIMKNKS
jgi:spore coat polysaccharide biosynthesis protein SpsF (cytidylyltransferase family)